MCSFDCVATVLTVYGIETNEMIDCERVSDLILLQQYLPFTVLKLHKPFKRFKFSVATVLTVYGIETL